MLWIELYKKINTDGTVSVGPNFTDEEFCGWRIWTEPGKILTYYGEIKGYIFDVSSLEGWDEIDDIRQS